MTAYVLDIFVDMNIACILNVIIRNVEFRSKCSL